MLIRKNIKRRRLPGQYPFQVHEHLPLSLRINHHKGTSIVEIEPSTSISLIPQPAQVNPSQPESQQASSHHLSPQTSTPHLFVASKDSPDYPSVLLLIISLPTMAQSYRSPTPTSSYKQDRQTRPHPTPPPDPERRPTYRNHTDVHQSARACSTYTQGSF